MRLVWALLALAACKGGSGDDYPVNPGGDDTVFPPMPDASPPDGTSGDGGTLAGRVCVVVDLRSLTCATGDVSGITVTLGAASTTTAADGSFALDPPGGANLVWHVTGDDLVPSAIPFTTSTLLPVVGTGLYGDLVSTNGVILTGGEGSAVLLVSMAGAPLAGATGAVSVGRVFAETNTALTWNEDGATGAHGVLWFASVLVGTAVTFTVTPATDPAQQVTLPVEDGAITFASVSIP